ncbi:Cyclin-like F-box [Ophiocordyceps camponoti-floridani]|uniref:Cyclin-like F-box n=1 Tax=Ophiocordyceps camponoti-floridani TaxID=2030778 RepID=A0A8H4Q1B6_9HYPO|nr:Cyclin-like F-box [Ophiocordyceps camponoti-floridani]
MRNSILWLLTALSLSIDTASAQKRKIARPFTQAGLRDGFPDGVTLEGGGRFASLVKTASVQVEGSNEVFDLRYRIFAPVDQFLKSSGVKGAAASEADCDRSRNGINIVLHGDSADSWVDFPNKKGFKANFDGQRTRFFGAAVLAPNDRPIWGGDFIGGGKEDRKDCIPHMDALSQLIRTNMANDTCFDTQKTTFMTISGGSNVFTNCFMPRHLETFPKMAAVVGCGAVPPRDGLFTKASEEALATARIHFQSTQNEAKGFQVTLPQAIAKYSELGLQSANQSALDELQTFDNTPAGGHCEFDGRSFKTGSDVLVASIPQILFKGEAVNGFVPQPFSQVGTLQFARDQQPRSQLGRRKRRARRAQSTPTVIG